MARDDEGIAAGEDDFPYLGVFPDIVQGGFEVLVPEHGVARSDDFPAEAEAAVDRADVHGLQQHPVGIAVGDSLDGGEGDVPDGVFAFLRGTGQFQAGGDELPAHRVIRLENAVLHGRCDADGVALGDLGDRRKVAFVDQLVG
ncbi:hypothetical protein ACFQ2B_33110 [Streptomyces stramineus]